MVIATFRRKYAVLLCKYAHDLPSLHKNNHHKNERFSQIFHMLKIGHFARFGTICATLKT